MNTRWMECEFVDAKLFALWCKEQEIGKHDDNTDRRLYDWENKPNMTLSVYRVDEFLTGFGWHISEVPDHVWIDEPKKKTRRPPVRIPTEVKLATVERVKAGEISQGEAGRELGITREAVTAWCHGRGLAEVNAGRKVAA
jgi:hypothetical protein